MAFTHTIEPFKASALPHFASDKRAGGLKMVLDWLAAEEPQQLTLADIARAAGFGEPDAITSALWVATVLSTGPVPVLDLLYVFMDEDGCEHCIPPQPGMKDDTGIAHPVTGVLVADWESRTSLQFRPAIPELDASPSP